MRRPTLDLTPVVGVVMDDYDADVERALHETTALQDDAFWAAFVRGPFTWPRFIYWWTARRWVRPRDITKE